MTADLLKAKIFHEWAWAMMSKKFRFGDWRPCHRSAVIVCWIWVWVTTNGGPSLCPMQPFPLLAQSRHGCDRVTKGIMIDCVNKYWFTAGIFSYADQYCKKARPSQANDPVTQGPFDHPMMDFYWGKLIGRIQRLLIIDILFLMV